MSALPRSIPDAVGDAARRWPTHEAIVDGETRIDFASLADRVARAATRFAELGIAHGARVGIWAPNSSDWIIACAGAQTAGAVVVPINSRLKGAEAAYILNKTRAEVLLTVPSFAGNNYPALLNGQYLPHLKHLLLLDQSWRTSLHDLEPAERTPTELADIIFTSGTTGAPKGVMATHFQNIATADSWATPVGLREGDRYLLVNPFFHCFGYKAGWLPCLLRGATAVSMPSFDAKALIDTIERECITVLAGAPTIFQTMLDTPGAAARTATLRTAVTGAASVPPSLIADMRDVLAIPTVLTGYGLTEATGVVSMSDTSDSPEVAATTAGRAVPGVEVAVFGPDGRAVPLGVEGEIRVRGYNVMAGYFEDESATRDAVDAQGWLHTGDVGRITDQGCLQITDRLKDMYISGGFNCYPAEIERLLCGHPAIAQAAVVGTPDPRLGEVGKAFVVLRPAANAAPDEIIQWARSAMANYKVPRYVELVPELPTNPSGKVQKYLLRGEPSAARGRVM